MMIAPQRETKTASSMPGRASSAGVLDSAIIAAQAGLTACALAEVTCRAALMTEPSWPGATSAVLETAAQTASHLRGRLEAILAEARAVLERAPADELPIRSAMDGAARRAALQRQASTTATLHDAIGRTCADVLFLLRTLPAPVDPAGPDATTARLLAEAGLRTAVHVLEEDLARLSDPYARHAFQGRLEQLRQRLETLGAQRQAKAR